MGNSYPQTPPRQIKLNSSIYPPKLQRKKTKKEIKKAKAERNKYDQPDYYMDPNIIYTRSPEY